jgi:hypothetical protein
MFKAIVASDKTFFQPLECNVGTVSDYKTVFGDQDSSQVKKGGRAHEPQNIAEED